MTNLKFRCQDVQEAGGAGDGKGPSSWPRWEQVKLQRAEWAMPRTVPSHFSRVLYLSNLKPVRLGPAQGVAL